MLKTKETKTKVTTRMEATTRKTLSQDLPIRRTLSIDMKRKKAKNLLRVKKETKIKESKRNTSPSKKRPTKLPRQILRLRRLKLLLKSTSLPLNEKYWSTGSKTDLKSPFYLSVFIDHSWFRCKFDEVWRSLNEESTVFNRN